MNQTTTSTAANSFPDIPREMSFQEFIDKMVGSGYEVEQPAIVHETGDVKTNYFNQLARAMDGGDLGPFRVEITEREDDGLPNAGYVIGPNIVYVADMKRNEITYKFSLNTDDINADE